MQKWQTIDVQSINSEKAKHVNIDIGGAIPVNLHFHAGSKDNVEEIIAKLNSSKALADSSSAGRDSLAQPRPSEEVPAPKKASVHFSNTAPDIIPTPDEDDEVEEDEQHHEENPSINGNGYPMHHSDEGESGIALYDFTADGDDELSIREGEHLTILEREGDEWWKCRNSEGGEGVVPASYIEVFVLHSMLLEVLNRML